jgi:hypothetical protein
MSTQVNPQEIFLLERYTSLDYFGELRDTWAELIKHVESCLDCFMRNLPPDYRSKPLPEQPDIVWGERILPNFRDTLQKLNNGFILLSHGEVKGLNYAHGPLNDFKGQMDFWAGWMPKADEDSYGGLLNSATTMAGNICASEGAYWQPLELSNYSDELGPLDPPVQWPNYRINRKVSVVSGGKTPQSGIYVPDVDSSCAEFLSTEYDEAPLAIVLVGIDELLDSTTGEKYDEEPLFEDRTCVWYLVERSPDLNCAHTSVTTQFHRVAAGETCPETGFYLTPARPESRRLFQKGVVMPAFDTAYGSTIWQWDSNQV